jgi:hypothetical protein
VVPSIPTGFPAALVCFKDEFAQRSGMDRSWVAALRLSFDLMAVKLSPEKSQLPGAPKIQQLPSSENPLLDCFPAEQRSTGKRAEELSIQHRSPAQQLAAHPSPGLQLTAEEAFAHRPRKWGSSCGSGGSGTRSLRVQARPPSPPPATPIHV